MQRPAIRQTNIGLHLEELRGIAVLAVKRAFLPLVHSL